MMFACCYCGQDLQLDKDDYTVCSECAGFCCSDDCLSEHECDPEGDM